MDSLTHAPGAVDDFGNPLEDGGGSGLGLTEAYVTSTPLYKLKLGVAGSSDGLACAEAAGVPLSIVQRAAQIKEAVINNSPLSAASPLNRDTLSSRQPVSRSHLTN